MHAVSRHPSGARARCVEAGPGSKSRAEAYGGILGSWERPPRFFAYSRERTTPAYQRPGAGAAVLAAPASEVRETAKEPTREENRSGWDGVGGRRSGRIVAMKSRRTGTGGSL